MGEWRTVELSEVAMDGPRLTLRRFRATDVPFVHAAMQHAIMHEFLPLPDPYTEDDARAFVSGSAQRGLDDGTAIESAIVDRSSGQLVGAGALRLPGPLSVTAEIGYSIYPVGQGNGYAAEVARLFTDWAHRHDVDRVQIRAAVENLASIRTAMAAGFRYEGIERHGVLTSRGAMDGAVFSRLPDDSPDPVGPAFTALPPDGLSDGVLALRVARREDAASRLAESRDPQALRWSFTGRPLTEAEASRDTARAGLDWLVGQRAPLTMVDLASGTAAGTLDLRLAGPPGVGGIGYSVRPQWRGRGFTARALRLISEWALGAGGFNRLELGAKIDNIASQRAARSGGFTDDGVARGRLRHPDGTFSDEARFVRLSR